MTTLTIAQAEASSATSGLTVADTAANIIAGLTAYPNLAAKVTSFTLTAAATLTAAQAEQLGVLGGKMHLGGYALTVSDSLANLAATANTAGVALATSVAVVDAAYNLLAAPLSRFTHVASVTLVGSPSLTVAEINHLLLLPHFAYSPQSSVTLTDTAGNINTALNAGAATNPALLRAVSSFNVHLDGSAVGAYTAALLETQIVAGKHVVFTPSGSNTALLINAAVSSIAANAASLNALATHVSLAYTLAGTANTVSAAYGAALEGLSGFTSHLSAVTISDTAANVASHASALFGQGFSAIDVTSGTLATTAANLLASNLQLQGASATLASNATLTAAQATTLTSLHGFTLGHLVTLTVQDTMAHLLALGSGTLSYVTTTELLPETSLTLSVAQAATLGAVTGFTNTGANITVADSIANLQGSSAWHAVATATDVVDTAANLLSNASLPLVTGAAAVTLSAGATVSAAGAATLYGLPSFSRGTYTLIVLDTAANIAANISAIDAIASVAEVNGTSSVSAAQAESLATLPLPNALILLQGAQLIVADSYANIIATGNASGTALATGFSILDNGANLATAAAHNWGSITPSYQLNAASTVTAAQLTTLVDLGSAFVQNAYALTIADTVADVLALSSAIRNVAAGIVITDIAADVTTSALNTLKTDALSVPLSIKISDNGHVLVSTATYSADTSVIDSISYVTGTAGPVTVTGTASAILGLATTLNADTHVGAVAITDSVAHLTTSVFNQLKANLTVPLTITLSDPGTALTFTAATYTADTAQIDAVQNATNLQVADTAANLSAIATALAADSKVNGVYLTDTAGNISAADTGVAAAALSSLDSKLHVTLTASGTVSAAALSLILFAESFTPAGFTLSLADTVANVAALPVSLLDYVTSIAITDTSANLTTTALNTLAADEAALTALNNAATPLTITLSDSGTVSVSAATYTADASIIDDITNTGAVTVTGTAAAIMPIATTLTNDAKVGAIVVSDTAANVVADLSALLAIGSKLSVTLTDLLPITAALVPQLVALDITNPSHITIADTGSNLASLIESASVATASFLSAATVQLSANSAVTAADAAALQGLSSFVLGGYTLSVWDTYSHLTSGVYASALANADVSAIYLQTGGAAVTLTAAKMLAQLALPNFHTSNPDLTPNTITISDTAAHFAADYTTLAADAAQLAGVTDVVNANATVSDSVLAHLQALGASAGLGVSITVRDTALTIEQYAPLQAVGGSITPAAWDLSASASISLAQAETLGTILNFAPGAYTLTVSHTTTDPITVLNANALGALGSALSLTGGGQLDAQGTVAQLTPLTSNALAIVTPQITDSFSNIAALTNASPLLGGTIVVNDSESVNAAAADAFFGIIKVGVGAGIAASHVSFAATDTETVTDTIANLQTLAALPAYSANSALASAFTLGAADTVANLVNSANTSFLEGLASSTLITSSTTTAANAESLFLIENEIHFAKDGSTLSVQDTAANLLDPANSDGIALADHLLLLGDDTTDAAGAETLLGNSKFALTHVLTVEDTAANLLDGTLGPLLASGDYGSNLVVELSAPTTVDATTATELVALAGFADPSHELTISDDPAYLLASSALAAETLATSVTIPTDETVSAATVYRLSEVPNFTPGAHHLILAANDVANDATLAAIGSFGSSFSDGGNTITMTADDISLSAAAYNSLLSDNVVTNGHLFGAIAATPGVTGDTELSSPTRILTLSTPHAANGTFAMYDSTGTAIGISHSVAGTNSETVTYTDSANNFSLTESIGNGTASAPVVLLDTTTITNAITAQSGSYAGVSGANTVYIGVGEYLPVYTTATLPEGILTSALVYSPSVHTLSLETPNEGPTTLIALGGTSFPSALTASEIHLKTFS
jgi:hypothetical protein